MTLFGITWGAIENSIYLLVLPVIAIFLYSSTYRYYKMIDQLVAHKWRKKLLINYTAWKPLVKSVLLSVGFLFLFLSLLQPQWGIKKNKVQQEGRELFIALDISRSMLAQDIKPHRLAFAKSKIRQLIKLLPSDRVGLLVFSGDALVQCPLTTDKAAFNLFLDAVDVETISSGTTAIAQALHTIIKMFSSMPVRKNKVVVLFTDGEDFSSNLQKIKSEAQKEHIHIFTYGIGTKDGAPVPVINEQGEQIGHQKDTSENVVISRLNDDILKALARESGGKYISPTQNNNDLKILVNEVQKYEKEKMEDREVSSKEERYPYFLSVSFLSFLIEWLL